MAKKPLEPLTLIAVLLLVLILIVLYQYRHIFSFHSYRWMVKSLKKRMDEPSKPKVERVCPKCGDTMEEGCLVASEGIYWSKNPPNNSFKMSFLGTQLLGEPLAFHLPYPIRASILRASRCRMCGITLVDMEWQDFNVM